MSEKENTLKILKSFLETLDIDGVCKFWIDEETELPIVYIVIDTNWLQEIPTKPEFVARRMRAFLSDEIEKFTGLKVHVGSYADRC